MIYKGYLKQREKGIKTISFYSLFGFIWCTIVALGFQSCKGKPTNQVKSSVSYTSTAINPDKLLNKATNQLTKQLTFAIENERIPRTINAKGEIHWTGEVFDWTEGFFIGSLWYLYEYTNDSKWKNGAENLQTKFNSHKLLTNNHDLGFVFNTSYGNAYKVTKNDNYMQVMLTAANSLITRFNPKVGCIKSWDVDTGWQSQRDWKFPVIIDNMMNLELLFKASMLSNDPKYREIAITHANTTQKNHFRENYSTYHVIDYDPITGEIRKKETAQGYSNESDWARGQAWGLYGYTVAYRYTKDKRYLDQAKKIADFILSETVKKNSCIPYWDYDAPKIPDEPRDASAASITVSALIELDTYTSNSYLASINKILTDLSSNKYTSKIGENNYFILKHSVGSIPHNNEIDVPLNYSDYYYIEALMRYKSKYLISS